MGPLKVSSTMMSHHGENPSFSTRHDEPTSKMLVHVECPVLRHIWQPGLGATLLNWITSPIMWGRLNTHNKCPIQLLTF